MSLVIATNIASMQAQRALNSSTSELGATLERLSSGQRINGPSDDPAALSLLSALRTDVVLATAAQRNVNDGLSALAVADGGLGAITNILFRILELGQQGANGLWSLQQRSALNLEVQALSSEIERIALTTEFNDIKLLSSGASLGIQVGFNSLSTSQISVGGVSGTLQTLKYADSGSSEMKHTLLGSSTAEAILNAQTLIGATREALDIVGQARGMLGANESRLESSLRTLESQKVNTAAAASRIGDVDVAEETSRLIRLQIQQQTAAAVLAHANLQPKIVLELLS